MASLNSTAQHSTAQHSSSAGFPLVAAVHLRDLTKPNDSLTRASLRLATAANSLPFNDSAGCRQPLPFNRGDRFLFHWNGPADVVRACFMLSLSLSLALSHSAAVCRFVLCGGAAVSCRCAAPMQALYYCGVYLSSTPPLTFVSAVFPSLNSSPPA